MEVFGFNQESISVYIKLDFAGNQGLLDHLKDNVLVQNVCSIPLNCAIVCYLVVKLLVLVSYVLIHPNTSI